MLRSLKEYDCKTTTNMIVDVPQGIYEGFYIHIAATVASGGLLDVSGDVCNITVYIGGIPVIVSSFRTLFAMNQRMFGAPVQVTPATGATYVSCYIPASICPNQLANSFFCERDGNIRIQITTGTIITSTITFTGAPVLTVLANTSTAKSLYVPWYVEQVDTMAAGMNTLARTSVENVTDVFMTAVTSANVSRILVSKGSELLECSWIASWNAANIFDEIELGEVVGTTDTLAATPGGAGSGASSGTVGTTHIILASGRSLQGMISDSVDVKITATGATDVRSLFCGGQFLGENSFKSAEFIRSSIDSQLAKSTKSKQVKYAKAVGNQQNISRAKISEIVMKLSS